MTDNRNIIFNDWRDKVYEILSVNFNCKQRINYTKDYGPEGACYHIGQVKQVKGHNENNFWFRFL